MCKQFVEDTTSARNGYLKDSSFYVTMDMFDRNLVSEGEVGYDINKRIDVGDMIQVTTGGGNMATSITVILKGGQLPAISLPTDSIYDLTEISETTCYAVGKVTYNDYVKGIVLVDVDGVVYPFYANVVAEIDTSSNEITQLMKANLTEGDVIYLYAKTGRSTFMVRNKQ